jgi:hypothetical protein
LTQNGDATNEVFRKAASRAVAEWGRDGEAFKDLVQNLWVWYLESPGTQRKLASSDEFLARRLVYKAALQILAGEAIDDDTFCGRPLYSVDSVKDALKGESTNRHLPELLMLGMDAVQHKDEESENSDDHRGYAEAIRSRYEDGVIPDRGSAQVRLVRAIKSLTEEINVLYLTANARGRDAMFPELRKRNGDHSDPTGEIACTLIEHPELREEFYPQLSVDLLLKGAHAQPIRWDVQRHVEVRDVPLSDHTGTIPAREADAD